MSKQSTIVLKFGGSVLLDENRLRIAVHEIYRWRREGWRVIAVVSALAGRTEELIARCSSLFADASDLCKASVIASGEIESASLLGVHLDRAGIPAFVLTPGGIGLVAQGDPLDSNPVAVNSAQIEDTLDKCGVVVIPGFVAINESGSTVTLGRGGSDLTAVFLAGALGAQRCRLIKDVDGLYESDPARAFPPPKRFGYARYQDAFETDGSIIQHKAVQFARRHEIEFELGRFNGTRPTQIGGGATKHDDEPDDSSVLDVAICGLGTIGRGVLELIEQLPELFTLIGGACRTPAKHADLDLLRGKITNNASALAGSGAHVVVELIGGTSDAWEIATNAFGAHSHLITANKTLIAEHGQALQRLADDSMLSVRYSASVGGVAPILETIKSLANAPATVQTVHGVLNGTGNFVLSSLERGATLEEAVAQAQHLGFAEADPSRDLDGRDSHDKLNVIAQCIGWDHGNLTASLESISQWASRADDSSFPARHLATLTHETASVHIKEVDPGGIFGKLENEWNTAVIEFTDGTIQTVKGKGAGCWPTSEAVFADLLELSREVSHTKSKREFSHV